MATIKNVVYYQMILNGTNGYVPVVYVENPVNNENLFIPATLRESIAKYDNGELFWVAYATKQNNINLYPIISDFSRSTFVVNADKRINCVYNTGNYQLTWRIETSNQLLLNGDTSHWYSNGQEVSRPFFIADNSHKIIGTGYTGQSSIEEGLPVSESNNNPAGVVVNSPPLAKVATGNTFSDMNITLYTNYDNYLFDVGIQVIPFTQKPIIYIPVNSTLSGPESAASGDTVNVSATFPDGYIYQQKGVSIYNKNGAIPFEYNNGTISFTMP